MFQEIFRGVSRKLSKCFKEDLEVVQRLFHRNNKILQGSCRRCFSVSRLFQVSFNEVESLKSASKVLKKWFQICSREV